MGRQKGFIRLKGSLGGLTFYDQNGKPLVRTTGGVDGERIATDPQFKRTRENMSEFGGSAKVGKALRMGFAPVVKTMGTSTLAGRVTGLMSRVNKAGTGLRGERGFDIAGNAGLIEGFEFNPEVPLGSVFYAPYAAPSFNANRDIVTWTVPDFNADSYLNVPGGATHFALVLHVAVLSNYVYDSGVKGYVAVHEAENEENALVISSQYPVKGAIGSDIVLSADLGIGSALPAEVGVLAGAGIIFSQEINGAYYELASDNAMRIEAVG